jgi:serine/threonine protein kinase
MPPPPELVRHPDYDLVRPLGRGGVGRVYLVKNRLLARHEVIKVLAPEVLSRADIRERFLREMQAAARLSHPNVVAAYAAVRLGDGLGLAMEYVNGHDLGEVVKVRGPVGVASACGYLVQVCHGLQHAHERGMVHRDINPGNVMRCRLDNRTVLKLLDFGLAKAVSEEPAENGVTKAGQVIGTPEYMAPEQAYHAAAADIRADLYAVGCLAHFLIAGKPPFTAPTMYELFRAHRADPPPPLPDLPPGLATVIDKLLAKEPGRRFQTPAEAATALTPFAKAVPAALPASVVLSAPLPARAADTLPPSVVPRRFVQRKPAVARPVHRPDPPPEPLVRRRPKRSPLWVPLAAAVGGIGVLVVAVLAVGLLALRR